MRLREAVQQQQRRTAAGGADEESRVVRGDVARRTLNTIDTAVKNFDRNPTRVIFGGGTPATAAPAPAQGAAPARR